MSGERINKIEINMATLNQKVAFTNKAVERIEKKIDDFVESASSKFAKKYVEDELNEVMDKIDDIRNMREIRSYEWLKYAVVTAIATAIGITMNKLL